MTELISVGNWKRSSQIWINNTKNLRTFQNSISKIIYRNLASMVRWCKSEKTLFANESKHWRHWNHELFPKKQFADTFLVEFQTIYPKSTTITLWLLRSEGTVPSTKPTEDRNIRQISYQAIEREETTSYKSWINIKKKRCWIHYWARVGHGQDQNSHQTMQKICLPKSVMQFA